MTRNQPTRDTAIVALFVAGFLVIVPAWLSFLASRRLLWFDELATVYLARLSPSSLWTALTQGADANPPLLHLMTHGLFAVMGESALTARLPSILGFLTMCLCLGRVIGQRHGAWSGLAAMVFPLATGGANFAIEARPYGLLMGFAGLAWLGWSGAAHGPRRQSGLLLLTASLTCALCSHYYAVLLWVPLGVGELVRWRIRGRIDVLVSLAMGLAVIPLLLFRPLLASLGQYKASFWAKPSLLELAGAYVELLAPALPMIVCALGGIALMARSEPERDSRKAEGFALDEVVVLVAFAALPGIAYLLAIGSTGAFTWRYVLPAIVGLTGLLSMVPHWTGSWHGKERKVLLGICVLGAIAAQGMLWRDLAPQRLDPGQLGAPMDIGVSLRPIVVSDPDRFLQLAYYEPGLIPRGLLYVRDGRNTAEQILEKLARWTSLPVVSREEFEQSLGTRSFLLYGQDRDWLPAALIGEGAEVLVKNLDDGRFVAVVRRPGAGP